MAVRRKRKQGINPVILYAVLAVCVVLGIISIIKMTKKEPSDGGKQPTGVTQQATKTPDKPTGTA